MYDNVKAQRAVSFINLLKHTKGRWHGQPFDLLPWQDKIVRDIFGSIKDNGYRQYNTAYVEIPKKNGKALALDTLIATPTGWTTMEKLVVGDEVFDENGKVCKVVACTEVMYGRPCYKVKFSDKSTIVADEEHLWQTNSYFPKYDTYIMDTIKISERIKEKTGYCHRIMNPGALHLPDRKLVIHPYVLGVWLADGNSHNASFTCNINDTEIARKVVACGVKLREWKSTGTGCIHLAFGDGDKRQSARNKSWQAKMRKMDLLCNKHIPSEYLRASIDQRLELLKGLMDSDGYISKDGQCEYTTVSKRLAGDVVELIRSLGFKCTIGEGIAKLNGRECGLKYRIRFYTYRSNPVFSLQRKRMRLKEDPEKPTRNSFRTIVDVEKQIQYL